MADRTSSTTAVGVAWLRAAHQLLDARPLLLDDPVALPILGDGAEWRIRLGAARFDAPGARALRSHVVLRSRYAEDRLAAAVARGVRQYLVLGAGLDTFAYRAPAWARDVRVVEVDQPASQADKQARLAAAGITVPDTVAFAAVDFERETLADGLRRCGVRLDVPTVCAWLGVTMYLTEAAVDATFRTVAGLPAGSEVVFTFAQPRSAAPPDDEAADPAARGPTLAERAAAVGEPWQSYFTPEALAARLPALGYGAVHFLTPDEAVARYYAGRPDALPPPRRTSIAVAVV